MPLYTYPANRAQTTHASNRDRAQTWLDAARRNLDAAHTDLALAEQAHGPRMRAVAHYQGCVVEAARLWALAVENARRYGLYVD